MSEGFATSPAGAETSSSSGDAVVELEEEPRTVGQHDPAPEVPAGTEEGETG